MLLTTPSASLNQTTNETHQTPNQSTLQMRKTIRSPALVLRILLKLRHTSMLDVHFVTYLVTGDTRGVYWRSLGVLSLHLTTSSLLTGLSQAKSRGRVSINTSLLDFRSPHPPVLNLRTCSISILQLSIRISIYWNRKRGSIKTTVTPPLSFIEI